MWALKPLRILFSKTGGHEQLCGNGGSTHSGTHVLFHIRTLKRSLKGSPARTWLLGYLWMGQYLHLGTLQILRGCTDLVRGRTLQITPV